MITAVSVPDNVRGGCEGLHPPAQEQAHVQVSAGDNAGKYLRIMLKIFAYAKNICWSQQQEEEDERQPAGLPARADTRPRHPRARQPQVGPQQKWQLYT